MSEEPLDIVGTWWNNNYGWFAIKLLWVGINSHVVLAYRPLRDDFTIIKICPTEDYENAEIEISTYRKIGEHPNLLSAITSWTWKSKYGNHICIRFPVLGSSTYDIIKKFTLSEEILSRWQLQITNALYCLHKKGYIHMDIRPENILLESPGPYFETIEQIVRNSYNREDFLELYPDKNVKPRNIKRWAIKWWETSRCDELLENIEVEFTEDYIENSNVVLIDIGNLIKKCDVPYRTTLPSEAISEHYRSPEMILDDNYDRSCDYWALGCTYYEWLTGDLLFTKIEPSKHAEEVLEFKNSNLDSYIDREYTELSSSILDSFLTLNTRERKNNVKKWVKSQILEVD